MAVTSSSLRALFGWGLVAAAAVLLAVAPGAAATESGEGDADVTRGGQLYALHCAQCHGADGQGAEVPRYGGLAPSLRPEDNPNISAAYLDLVMATGRMPPAESPYDNRERRLVIDTEADRAALVAWTRAELGVEGELPTVGEGEPANGQAVWNANCAHCHGSTGLGGVAGAGAWTPQVAGTSAEVIAEAVRVGPFQMPGFNDTQISESEVEDIVAFMDEVAEDPGTPILGLVELNPVYASAFVALLAAVLLVSLVWIGGRPARFPDPPKGEEPVPSGAARRTEPEAAS